MTQTLLTVRYTLEGDTAAFLAQMDAAATVIAGTPGLTWKIWSLDRQRGVGLSAYLFDDAAAAEAFAGSPLIDRLRARPDITSVAVDFAPVEPALSTTTKAAGALGRAA